MKTVSSPLLKRLCPDIFLPLLGSAARHLPVKTRQTGPAPLQATPFFVHTELFFTHTELFMAQKELFLAQKELFFTHTELFLAQKELFLAQKELFLAQKELFLAHTELFLAQKELFFDQKELFLARTGCRMGLLHPFAVRGFRQGGSFPWGREQPRFYLSAEERGKVFLSAPRGLAAAFRFNREDE